MFSAKQGGIIIIALCSKKTHDQSVSLMTTTTLHGCALLF